jgi:ribonuclease HI
VGRGRGQSCGTSPLPTDRTAATNVEQVPIGRKLMAALPTWRAIGAEDLVLRGVQAEWKNDREPVELQQRPWPPPFRRTPEQQRAYEMELRKELAEEIVEQTTREEARWVNPTFLIEKRPGEWRKILNCVQVNSYIRDKKMKMEDIKTVCDLSGGGEWATTLDIKAAYSHLRVTDELRPYLCFDYGGEFFRYRTMPFGLKQAPRVFCRLMRRVAAWARDRWQMKLVIYMDDMLILGDTQEETQKQTQRMKALLVSLGWTLSEDKCHTNPSHVVKFLGWNLDFQRQELQMTEKRRTTLLQTLFTLKQKAATRSTIPCRELASAIGALNFLRMQFPEASLYMLRLNQMKTAGVRRSSWSGMLTMTPKVQGELKWWTKAVTHNRPRCWRQTQVKATLTTDASPSGWGATWHETDKDPIYLWGSWPKTARGWTSNRRELTAIARGLEELIPSVQCGATISVQSDNTAAVFALKGWKASANRIPILRRLWNLLQHRGLKLTAHYLPGALNGVADKLSRMGESGDYYMTMTTLQRLREQWDIPLTLDVFASKETARLTRYCTKDAKDTGAVAINGLDTDWRHEIVLLHPPPALILKTIQKAIREEARGILITPNWRGQTWFPLLQNLTTQTMDLGPYATAVRRTAEMESRGWLLPPGNVLAHILGMKTTREKNCLTT